LLPLPSSSSTQLLGHVRSGTHFSLGLTLSSHSKVPVRIVSAALTGSQVFAAPLAASQLEVQLGLGSGSGSGSGAAASGGAAAITSDLAALVLAAAATAATAPAPAAAGGGLVLAPRDELRLLLTGTASPSGAAPADAAAASSGAVLALGALTLGWRAAGMEHTAYYSLQLPHVAVHCPPIVVDLVLPGPPAGSSTSASSAAAPAPAAAAPGHLSFGLRLSNRSHHFLSLEAAAFIPGSIPAAPATPSPGAELLPALPHVALQPGTPSSQTLELLPGAVKTARFACALPAPPPGSAPHAARSYALPSITLRPLEPRGAAQPPTFPPPMAPPQAAASSDGSAAPSYQPVLLGVQQDAAIPVRMMLAVGLPSYTQG
jgi:hypothetical protein